MRFILILSLVLFGYAEVFSQSIKYVFYFIGDGMGVNQVNGTEMYFAEKEDTIGVKSLSFTQFPASGLVTTYSKTNSVTDSAAGGTALACGEKTSNGTIGMNADHTEPIYSVAQMAKTKGAKVGIITSVSIDHATPASFYAHQPNRNMYYEIACQIPDAGFDFYGGAGFVSPNHNYKKNEVVSVYEILKRRNYNILEGVKGYQDGKSKENLVMIEKRGQNESLNLAIDRKEGDLTLKQITECAIRTLYNRNRGFFLMVEGGMIDWACHSNDAASLFNEVKDMDDAVKIALEFYEKYPEETLIVVTADHETGGLSLGNGPYELNLKLLAGQKASVNELSDKIQELAKGGKFVEWTTVRGILKEYLGFWDTVKLSKEEREELRDVYNEVFVGNDDSSKEGVTYSDAGKIAVKAVSILNKKANIAWGSNGHSAGYVPVFAIGKGCEVFNGKMDNTEIPEKIAELAGYILEKEK